MCRCAEEDRNFAHYNFVNEQNNEAQALKDRISQVSFSLLYKIFINDSLKKNKHVICLQSYLVATAMFVIPHFLDCIALLQTRLRLKESMKNDTNYSLKKNPITYVSACLVSAQNGSVQRCKLRLSSSKRRAHYRRNTTTHG